MIRRNIYKETIRYIGWGVEFLTFWHKEFNLYPVKISQFFKVSSTSYLIFAIEMIKRVSLLSHTSPRNITLCRDPHFARELLVDPIYGNEKMKGATQTRIHVINSFKYLDSKV